MLNAFNCKYFYEIMKSISSINRGKGCFPSRNGRKFEVNQIRSDRDFRVGLLKTQSGEEGLGSKQMPSASLSVPMRSISKANDRSGRGISKISLKQRIAPQAQHEDGNPVDLAVRRIGITSSSGDSTESAHPHPRQGQGRMTSVIRTRKKMPCCRRMPFMIDQD